MKIFLAGGAGYIGTHTAVELLNNGYEVVIVDDYANSCPEAVARVEELTGKKVALYEADVQDEQAMERIMLAEKPDTVIHFAGLKAVGESVQQPLRYYRNNINTTLSLLEAMEAVGVDKFIFSSSATVYGAQNPSPYKEDMPKGLCTNPYGWTKSMMEQILADAAVAYPRLGVVLLRYFNPIGAHESGRIGEDPQGIPNNLMPYVSQVAIGQRQELTIFGNDYDTPDGTCLRDYIHVVDLAEGHLKAVEFSKNHQGIDVFNLGTGKPYSVLDIVNTFQEVNQVPVKYTIGPRRAGDLPICYADASKAKAVLGWEAKKTLADMCRDSWNWQKHNPKGYRK